MLNKKTTRLLLLAVLVLGGLYWYSETQSSSSQERTFRSIVLELDSEQIQQFTVSRASEAAGPITMEKEGEDWFVGQGDQRYKADWETVTGFLTQFNQIKTKRFIGPGEKSRTSYGMDKTQASTVVLTDVNGKSTHVRIGKVDYANNAQGGQTGKISYFSIGDEEDICAGNSVLGNDVLREFNHWRPRYIWKGNNETWEKVILVEEGGSMTLEKKEGVWMMQDVPVIADRMQSYIDGITSGKVALFENNAKLDGLEPIKRLVIYDSMRDGPRSVNVYRWRGEEMVMVSEENPESVFVFDTERAYRKLFRPPSYFIPLDKLKDIVLSPTG